MWQRTVVDRCRNEICFQTRRVLLLSNSFPQFPPERYRYFKATTTADDELFIPPTKNTWPETKQYAFDHPPTTHNKTIPTGACKR